jgi:hypothetical protein
MNVAACTIINALFRIENIAVRLEPCGVEPSGISEFSLFELSPNTSFLEIQILWGKFVNSELRNVGKKVGKNYAGSIILAIVSWSVYILLSSFALTGCNYISIIINWQHMSPFFLHKHDISAICFINDLLSLLKLGWSIRI